MRDQPRWAVTAGRSAQSGVKGPALSLLGMVLLVSGCSSCDSGTSNRNGPANSNATSRDDNSNSSASARSRFYAKEPERYSATVTITRPSTSAAGAEPPLQFEFAKMGRDRRWVFELPQFGQAIYLEKAGLKYLVLTSRKQYVEVSPEALGYSIGEVPTIHTIVEQLRRRSQPERLGTETINTRVTTKYRFAVAPGQSSAPADAESIVYIDDTSALPVRIEIPVAETEGVRRLSIVETGNIQLNPDPGLFEVAAGTKKLPPESMRPQIQSLTGFVHNLASLMGQSLPAPKQPAQGENANRR